MLHRGEIIEKVIRESGYSITTIAQKLGKSRRWMYLLFDNPTVHIDLILQIGKIIYHDFSLEFPEIIKNQSIVLNEPSVSYQKTDDNFWKEKYFALLEEYNSLLKKELEKKSEEKKK
jgi:hypothetical protein